MTELPAGYAAERSVTHATFVLERTYAASPARVFAAFAEKEAKARWFAAPDEWGTSVWEMDFRVGGREINRGGPKDGPTYSFEASYQDIVANERIVYTYEMRLDENRISVSLATVVLEAAGDGTHLILTEQGVFLDGYDDAEQREEGTQGLLDALGSSLASEPAVR